MKEKMLLCFLFVPLFCFSQGGKLTGRLILKDVENYKSVFENTYIILKTNKKIDSVKVDKDLRFVFTDLTADTLKVFISPRPFPVNSYYRFYLKENESKNIELPYSSVCPYEKSKGNLCPVCHRNEEVIPIVYGFIAKITYKDKNGNLKDKNGKIISKEEQEKITYKSGGCVVRECQPNWFCQKDRIDF